LALHLLRIPLWLFDTAAALGGFVVSAIVLHDAQLAVVQPLLISELVFTLVDLPRGHAAHAALRPARGQAGVLDSTGSATGRGAGVAGSAG
jgi:hypothetical protein